MVMGEGLVFSVAGTNSKQHDLVARDLKTGQEKWRKNLLEFNPPVTHDMSLTYCQKGLLVVGTPGNIHGVNTADGNVQWTQGRGLSPFFIDGLLWVSRTPNWEGLDPATGTMQKSAPTGFFSGCGIAVATERFFIHSRSNEFIDRNAAKKVRTKTSIRGPCKLSFVPANGLLYSQLVRRSAGPVRLLHGYDARESRGRRCEERPAPPDRRRTGARFYAGFGS
jgi:hypothetical protein